MATITGNPLYAVAAYIIIAGGAIIFIIAFLGCCGAMTENRLMLTVVSIKFEEFHIKFTLSTNMNLFDVRFFYFIIVSYFYFQFCATLVLTFFILFIGAILAIVFRSQVSFFASGYIGEENS